MFAKSSKGLFREFDDIVQKIDVNILNIKTLPAKEIKPSSLKETNQLISSASLILAKINDIENENNTDVLNEKLRQLSERKKQISLLTSQYQLSMLKTIDNKNINENTLDNNYNNKEVDVGMVTDYNEKLLGDAMRNLNEVHSNLKETAINLRSQGGILSNDNEKMVKGVDIMKENNDIVSDIACSKKCQKIWMIIINVLLFSIIVLILMIKIMNFLK